MCTKTGQLFVGAQGLDSCLLVHKDWTAVCLCTRTGQLFVGAQRLDGCLFVHKDWTAVCWNINILLVYAKDSGPKKL